MNTVDNLHDLLLEELRDLYGLEKQMLQELPRLTELASDDELKTELSDHVEETEEHVARLERIFGLLKVPARAKSQRWATAMLEEMSGKVGAISITPLKDAILVGGVQRIEHAEISSYGTLRTFAETLGYVEIAELLQDTQDEEVAADERFSSVASNINLEAEQAAS